MDKKGQNDKWGINREIENDNLEEEENEVKETKENRKVFQKPQKREIKINTHANIKRDEATSTRREGNKHKYE